MTATRHAGLSDRGRVRPANEDRWFADDRQQLYVVADGMGGHPSGELAARIVVDSLPTQLRAALDAGDELSEKGVVDRVSGVVTALSRQLRDASHLQPGLDGMGTTVVLALIRREHALVVHLGDSSAFLLRDRRLERLTNDHTLAQLLLAHGTISVDETVSHRAASQLSRYVGMPGDALPDARLLDWRPGDRLLLGSDGLTRMLDEDRLSEILLTTSDAKLACDRLIDAANAAGGRDNITALIVECVRDRS